MYSFVLGAGWTPLLRGQGRGPGHCRREGPLDSSKLTSQREAGRGFKRPELQAQKRWSPPMSSALPRPLGQGSQA